MKNVADSAESLRSFILDKLAFYGCVATERYFQLVYPASKLDFLMDEDKARKKLEVLALPEAIGLLAQELELDCVFLTTDWYKKDYPPGSTKILIVSRINLTRNREHRERIAQVLYLESLFDEYAEPDYEHPDFD